MKVSNASQIWKQGNKLLLLAVLIMLLFLAEVPLFPSILIYFGVSNV